MHTQVAVIGSGPAGLAAALTLSRSMFKTVVLNGKTPPRNASSPFVAALPGMDHKAPAEMRAAVRRDILAYPFAEIEEICVEKIVINEDGFDLTLETGSNLKADRVLLATGMQDIMPTLNGLEDCWGKSIINCPFCHGYEWKDQRWGIYAHRPEVLDAAEIYRNWTSDLTYLIDPGLVLSKERHQELVAMGITIIRALPTEVRHEDGNLTHALLPDGSLVNLDCMLIFPHQTQVDLISSLSVVLTEDGYVKVDEGFRTSIPKIYAAGDLTYGGHQNTPTAFHMGNMAAATIVMDHSFRNRKRSD